MSALAKAGSGLYSAFRREPSGKVQTPESSTTPPKSSSSRSSIGLHKAATSNAFVCTATDLRYTLNHVVILRPRAQEILRKERSGFRQKALARKERALTPSRRLKLSPAEPVVLSTPSRQNRACWGPRCTRKCVESRSLPALNKGHVAKAMWPFPLMLHLLRCSEALDERAAMPAPHAQPAIATSSTGISAPEAIAIFTFLSIRGACSPISTCTPRAGGPDALCAIMRCMNSSANCRRSRW
jgi:hypothetical protein